VLAFSSLGETKAPRDDPPGLLAVQEEKKEEPLPAPVKDSEWDARDLEGKWALYQSRFNGRESEVRAWRQYLVKRRDHAFLEMLVLYRDDSAERLEFVRGLADSGASQWVRAVVWLRHASPADHTESLAKVLLTQRAPALTLAWLEKYRAELPDDKRLIEEDYLFLKKQKLPAADISKLSPPLKPAEVFRHLDAPKVLADLNNQKRAEPGRVYGQQVLRAIQGVVGSPYYREPWFGKVRQLTRHPRLEVRQAAYLAFTHFAIHIDPKASPMDDFAAVANDPKEPRAAREAALLAFTYFPHPKVYLELHRLALEPAHPGWRAAISRLGDLGNDFTLAHLNKLDPGKLFAKEEQLLRTTREGLERWVRERKAEHLPAYARSWLEQAAWAELVKDPLREALTTWTRDFFASRGDSKMVDELEKLAREYTPRFPVPGGEGGLQRRVRGLARDILAARPKGQPPGRDRGERGA
jgi:hypothetical protein